VRKEDTSCALAGSKGAGWNTLAGSWRVTPADEEEDDDDDDDDDFRPVKVSQIDIMKEGKG